MKARPRASNAWRRTMANPTHRGITDDVLVHYVWQDEYLYFTPECWTNGVEYKTFVIEETQAHVNCIQCLAIVDGR